MEALTQQDFQKILNFVQGLYTTEALQHLLSYVSRAIPSLIGADISGYSTIDFMQCQFLDGLLIPSIPISSEIVDQYFYDHPHHIHYLQTRDCRSYKLSDFLSEQELHQKEGLYQNFFRKIQIEEQLAVILPDTNPMKVDALTLFRHQRSFTERDRLVFNLLQPHLIQARQTGQLFSQMQQENKKLHNSLNNAGSIILSPKGKVQLMTQRAEKLLQQYFRKNSGQTLPESLQQWVNYQKSLQLETSSVTKSRIPLRLEQGDQQLIVRFITDPVNDQDLLLLEEQKPLSLSVESLEWLGLSRREAEVLFWVAKGKENAEIAKILYVSVTTIRKHLEHIYQKLDVTTRAAAIVTALQRLGMLKCE